MWKNKCKKSCGDDGKENSHFVATDSKFVKESEATTLDRQHCSILVMPCPNFFCFQEGETNRLRQEHSGL